MSKEEIAFWQAISDGHVDRFKEYLEITPLLSEESVASNPWKFAVDEAYHHETRPVHFCSLSGREALLKILLTHQPDLEAITFEENKGLTTPLVLAAWEGSLESCRLLLEAGANPNTCASAESPLYSAAEHHAWDKVDLLLAHGAKHDVFTACICGQLDLVKREITAYPPLLQRRSLKRHRTPREEAIAHGQLDMAAWLQIQETAQSEKD